MHSIVIYHFVIHFFHPPFKRPITRRLYRPITYIPVSKNRWGKVLVVLDTIHSFGGGGGGGGEGIFLTLYIPNSSRYIVVHDSQFDKLCLDQMFGKFVAPLTKKRLLLWQKCWPQLNDFLAKIRLTYHYDAMHAHPPSPHFTLPPPQKKGRTACILLLTAPIP